MKRILFLTLFFLPFIAVGQVVRNKSAVIPSPIVGSGSNLTLVSDTINNRGYFQIQKPDLTTVLRVKQTGRSALFSSDDNPIFSLVSKTGGYNPTLAFESQSLNKQYLLDMPVSGMNTGGLMLRKYDGNIENLGTISNSSIMFAVDTTGKFGVKNIPAYSLDVAGTDGIRIPRGTTAQRPTVAEGIIRFNTETDSIEYYNGTTWISLAGNARILYKENISAETTADTSTAALYTYHLVNASSAPRWVNPPSNPSAGDWFVVVDSRQSYASNDITVRFNSTGTKFASSATDFTIGFDLMGVSVKFIYVNSTVGWVRGN